MRTLHYVLVIIFSDIFCRRNCYPRHSWLERCVHVSMYAFEHAGVCTYVRACVFACACLWIVAQAFVYRVHTSNISFSFSFLFIINGS